MKERPILFSAPMVRAILDGRKTQTRRVVKPVRGYEHNSVCRPDMAADAGVVWWHGASERVGVLQSCPYSEPGDRLWVRETFCYADPDPSRHPDDKPEKWRPRGPCDEEGREPWCYYRATDADIIGTDSGFCGRNTSPWRPSIYMPRWASRITLEVTGVRVERLHDISDTDAMAEGADRDFSPCNPEDREDPREVGYSSASDVALHEATAHRRFFRSLWESINGADSWAANPWVWCINFRRVA